MTKHLPKIIGYVVNLTSYVSSPLAAKIAIYLFSTPRKGKTTSVESEFLKTANQDQIQLEDITIKTYYWEGHNQTILLAHGWESNSFRWKDLIEKLKTHNYNIVALDAPAHGSTNGKQFNALLYAQCINTVAEKFKVDTVIGHSVGGMATVFFIHKYQLKHIEKLVLLGAPSDFIGVFSRYETMMGYNNRVSKALENYILKHYNHLPEYFSPANFSKEIKAKGLIIHDKEDKIIPFEDGLRFKENYKNATFVTTKGLGHGLKSEQVYQNILDFIKV